MVGARPVSHGDRYTAGSRSSLERRSVGRSLHSRLYSNGSVPVSSPHRSISASTGDSHPDTDRSLDEPLLSML